VFLSHLAIASKVLASIQNPAIERTAIFYRQLLKINELWLTDAAAARRGKLLLGVLKVAEVRARIRGRVWITSWRPNSAPFWSVSTAYLSPRAGVRVVDERHAGD